MFDKLLIKQIQNDEQIKGMLTSYDEKPAFFYQKVLLIPIDCGVNLVTRVDYNVDMQYNPERKSSGILTINIWCTSESAAMPEDIEKRLRELIESTFYSENNVSVCAVWNRSDAFSFENNLNNSNNMQPEVFGTTVLFELMEFPEQITVDPDSIQAVNCWTKKYFPEIKIIAYDSLLPVWKPTDENPAIYWRFIDTNTDDKQSDYSVTWFIGHFSAHIIAETVTERNRWIKSIAEQLNINGEIVLNDGSPMFIKQIDIKNNADPLRDGQIIISGQYGILTQHKKETANIILNNSYFNGVIEMSETKENKKNNIRVDTNINNSVYSISELAEKSIKIFEVPPEIIEAALKQTGKAKLTISETKSILNKFLSREVK